MTYTANATTNEQGDQTTVIDTVSSVSINATPVANREIVKKEVESGEIGRLRYNDRYSLLAMYVIDKYKPYIRKVVSYGRNGAVNWIELNGKTIWERKGSIHDVHKGVK